MAWTLLTEFILHLNTVHSTLKFTSVISSSEIAFLDLTIYLTDDKLCTRLYTKNTDRHMYLNFNSEHPMKKSIPYSQFLRLKRIHSESHYLIQCTNSPLLVFYLEGISPWCCTRSLGTRPIRSPESHYWMTAQAKKNLKYLLCLSLHITVLIPTSGKSYLNIGPIWVGLVPPEN